MRRALLMVGLIVFMLLFSSCSRINDFDYIFNNDTDIIEDHSGVSFIYTGDISDDRMNIQIEMSGSLNLWEINAEENGSPFEIAYECSKVRGDFKLVLINPEKQIKVITDRRGSGTFQEDLPKGKSYIKLIGKSLKMDFSANLKYQSADEIVNFFR